MTDEATLPAQPIADLEDTVAVHSFGPGRTVILAGHKCVACDSLHLRPGLACPACGSGGLWPVAVGPSGTLYTYSTVHVSSGRQTPYTIGYVDLDAGARVLASIVARHEEDLTPDARGNLVDLGDGDWGFLVDGRRP